MLPRLLLAVSLALALGARPAVPVAGLVLTGRLLVATPELLDPHFRRTVVFVARHDEAGAFGLVVNRKIGRERYGTLLRAMGREGKGATREVNLHEGGPVQPDRLFVLHTRTDGDAPLIAVNERYGISSSAELIEALARGEGPERALLVLGYAGWGPGQLEHELALGGWAIAPADDAILFDEDHATKWRRALESQLVPI